MYWTLELAYHLEDEEERYEGCRKVCEREGNHIACAISEWLFDTR